MSDKTVSELADEIRAERQRLDADYAAFRAGAITFLSQQMTEIETMNIDDDLEASDEDPPETRE